jgi:hypothetical protein
MLYVIEKREPVVENNNRKTHERYQQTLMTV